MNFKGWYDLKAKNEELKDNEKLYCKSHLKEISMKPKKNAVGEFHKVYTGGKWKEFEFFKIYQAEPTRVRRKSEIRDLDINPKNLCESLYVINKSAKKSRDSKNENYYKRNHGIVKRCKDRQNDLYEIKDLVLNKMIDEDKVKLEGYHIQKNNMGISYLLLYKYNDYSFHLLEDKKPQNVPFLGEITGVISAEVKRKIDIKFNEATKLLNKYLDNEKLQGRNDL